MTPSNKVLLKNVFVWILWKSLNFTSIHVYLINRTVKDNANVEHVFLFVCFYLQGHTENLLQGGNCPKMKPDDSFGLSSYLSVTWLSCEISLVTLLMTVCWTCNDFWMDHEGKKGNMNKGQTCSGECFPPRTFDSPKTDKDVLKLSDCVGPKRHRCRTVENSAIPVDPCLGIMKENVDNQDCMGGFFGRIPLARWNIKHIWLKR